MERFKVMRITNLLTLDLVPLLNESKATGFRFLERLVNDYQNGSNTFNKPSELLMGVFNHQGLLIAIGGLNIDPFLEDPTIGRLRRFYVAQDYRRSGIGTLLLSRIMAEAKNCFQVLVLHTDTHSGDQFYTAFGFKKDGKYPQSTHYLNVNLASHSTNRLALIDFTVDSKAKGADMDENKEFGSFRINCS